MADKKQSQQEELNVAIYEAVGSIDSYGYNTFEKGLVYFLANNNPVIGTRGDARQNAESAICSIGRCLMTSAPPFSRVNFQYGETNHSFPVFLDGFFGRPAICVGAVFLKPVRKNRQKRLLWELQRIGYVEDKKGRRIPISA